MKKSCRRKCRPPVPPPDDPDPIEFYNVEIVVSCPATYTGTPVTIPAGTVRSTTSQAHADELARDLAQSQIVCTPVDSNPNLSSKKIYGHYIGAFAPGYGAIQFHALNGLVTLDAPGSVISDRSNLAAWAAGAVGGTYRNFALAPQDSSLTLAQAAELEIKRAMRIGLDGFTFDAWAGSKSARDLLDAMFTVCETQDLPFELTITLDTASLNVTDPDIAAYPGNTWTKTLNWLIDRHGTSPKLARRNGKVLIMGYQSIWPGQAAIADYVNAEMPGATSSEKTARRNQLRTTPEGWQMIVDTYAAMETFVGVPIYWEFCLNQFFVGTTGAPPLATAASWLADHFPAFGLFEWVTNTPTIAAAVIAKGAEWSHPMKLQYENYGYYQSASTGLNWLRGDWNYAKNLPSTLLQHITWNDYHENTQLSPSYNQRYAYYDLTKHFIEEWKNGTAPASATDKVYIFSHKYAHNTPMFPFKALTRADNKIEILTILPTAATFRCPGRLTTLGEATWVAPAGMSYKQFPLLAGPVSVEWSRDGFVSDVNTLVLPDPVSDKPFRQETGKTAICTEEQAQWTLDFGAAPMFVHTEYADVDSDGLPNWFEMLWYGTFGKMSTAAVADPAADPNSTGKTNLQHFTDQTDPYA
jgi:hypothetical protein